MKNKLLILAVASVIIFTSLIIYSYPKPIQQTSTKLISNVIGDKDYYGLV